MATPLKSLLNVDVTSNVVAHNEESLTTPPSECYAAHPTNTKRVTRSSGNQTPVKTLQTSFKQVLSGQSSKPCMDDLKSPVRSSPSKNFRSINLESTPPCVEEEESLITPPSERYNAHDGEVEQKDEVGVSTPPKNSELLYPFEPVVCTPLKALREAVRLATPSPVKPMQRRNVPTTPGKWLNSLNQQQQAATTPLKRLASEPIFSPSPCKRPPTTPAKWFDLQKLCLLRNEVPNSAVLFVILRYYNSLIC